jgi:lysylphosphatidylglycerol synthetase-like protein (DUF2156 family)
MASNPALVERPATSGPPEGHEQDHRAPKAGRMLMTSAIVVLVVAYLILGGLFAFRDSSGPIWYQFPSTRALIAMNLEVVSLAAGLLGTVLAFIGVILVAPVLPYSTGIKFLLCALLFIPLVSVVVLLYLKDQAKAALGKTDRTLSPPRVYGVGSG